MPRLFLLVALWMSVGCAHTLNLPRASFHGLTIQTVQPDPDDERLELEVGVDFQVDNPTGVRLVVPEHTFGLAIDGAPATSTGVHKSFAVKAKKKEVVTYALRLDPVALGKALGKDATYAFTADVDVDIADTVLRGVEDILGGVGGTSTTGMLAQAASDTASEASTYTMSFEHSGKLKVPKVPKIKAALQGQTAAVSLVGESEFLSLDDALGDLRTTGGPVVEILEQVLGQRPNQNVQLPLGDILEAMGVPANLTSGAVGALNTFLTLQGQSTLRGTSTSIELPVQLPKLNQLIATVDPNASTKINAFTSAWDGFSTGSIAGAQGLSIPTSLPSGLRVTAPFTLANPNEFTIQAPSFRLGLVDADGAPLLLIGTLPTSEVATTDLSVRRLSHQALDGQTDTSMSLVSEVHWDQLTGGLLNLASQGGTFALPNGLRLVGELTVDPGYGPITVPLNLSLMPGTGTSGAAATQSTAPATPAADEPAEEPEQTAPASPKKFPRGF